MKNPVVWSLMVAMIALAGACAHRDQKTEQPTPAIVEPAVAETTFIETEERCETAVFALDAQFPSAGMAACSVADSRTITVFIKPEDIPINPSPWYAVRVTPAVPGPVRVILRYDHHPHRYRPKISTDGKAWDHLPPSKVTANDGGYRVVLQLDLKDKPVFVSAQPLFTNAAYDAWNTGMAQRADVEKSTIGTSIEGRDITMLTTRAGAGDGKTLMLVGRQHPPEITGALAMIVFMEEILSDTKLAREFRNRFNIVMVPNMNPDGVVHGYWRHNVGGRDLNRDWGPFTQPETLAVKAVLDAIDTAPDQNLAVFLDFHSTRQNIFYTQPVGDDGTDYGFTAEWLRRSKKRLPDYGVKRKGSHQPDMPTSKTYIHARFGIPSITYELGDETSSAMIGKSARVLAQELMALLLEAERPAAAHDAMNPQAG